MFMGNLYALFKYSLQRIGKLKTKGITLGKKLDFTKMYQNYVSQQREKKLLLDR